MPVSLANTTRLPINGEPLSRGNGEKRTSHSLPSEAKKEKKFQTKKNNLVLWVFPG
jgi:hypothetical protein